MKSIKLKINTKTQKYSIIIGSNLGSGISKILRENSINFKQCLLVIDKNVSKHFISKIKKKGTSAKNPTKNRIPLKTYGPINSIPVSWAIKVVPQIKVHTRALSKDVDFDIN